MKTGEKMPGGAGTTPGDGRKGGDESAIASQYTPIYTDSSSHLQAALAYAARGWVVFPVWWIKRNGRCACGRPVGDPKCSPGKHPIAYYRWGRGEDDKEPIAPHGLNDATTDPATIRRWWARFPNANIGWALPEDVGVCDVDPRHGGHVDALPLTWRDRQTLAADTGGGGDHLAFRLPAAPAGRAYICGKLGEGLDFKTHGGYIVLAPSNHASGNAYTWKPGQGPGEVEILPAPPALLSILPVESRLAPIADHPAASPISDSLRERMTWVLSELCADFHPNQARGKLLCPFHHDSHPSFDYDLGRGVFYCYADGCPAHKRGNGVIELERLARTQHGLVYRPPAPEAAPDPTQAAAGAARAADHATVRQPYGPSPAPVFPWEIAPDDWHTCPICAAWHHSARAAAGGLVLKLHHKFCHRRDCELSGKVRAGDLLARVEGWPAIYSATVSEADWDRTRLRLRRAKADWLGIPTQAGELLTLTNAPDVLPDATITTDFDMIYEAVLRAPARVRRPHTATVNRMTADDYAALAPDLGEHAPDGDKFSPEQSKHERIVVMPLTMAAPEEPSELVALAKHITALGRFLPPEAGDKVRAAWAKLGIERQGNRAVATLEQGRRLVDELVRIRREVANRDMHDLAHIGAVGLYASIRACPPDAPPEGAPGEAQTYARRAAPVG